MSTNFTPAFYNGTGSSTTGFYIIAFDTLDNKNYLILVLSLIYICTLLGNLTVLLVVFLNQSLHNPKYISVCNLAVVDIIMNSVIIPQMVPVFVFNWNFISFQACFTQMFFMHYFGDLESFSLAVLAYDWLIAIYFPLRYSTINTNMRISVILAVIWAAVFCMEMYAVALAASLPYCASRIVRSCCCEHGPVYILACADITFNRKLATAKTLFVLFGPLSFIFITYIIIVIAVQKIASAKQRKKAFNTCFTHLLLVLIYYLPVILAYILGNLHLVRSPDLFTAILTVSVTLPPMLNPVIYSLKTEELSEKIMKLAGRHKTSPESIKRG
ncbi:olfactory receptor 52K1-like [Acipenser oxyrinchus oxyrinchus]|uniref:Olfactory receptor 52K1-like n=1 Tax=Acipenser oxyrinchus oxyrinchus TaxID=40147 RepID=A0AAD8DJ65_ACIOX|nr:olfactory receptor 52K1-like [Acipenser oxyrinchus oxyrinchus]